MPIKFKCSCGQVLSVPSKLAGKSGKCPKCAKTIKIPVPKAPSSTQAAAGKTAAAAPRQTPANQAGTAAGGLDSLFDDAGLVESSGPVCPNCTADIKPGTVVCTSCGFNIQTGEKLASYDAKSEGPEYDNLYLQQASDNMKRDKQMESRRDKSAMPWWVIMSFLIGAVMLCAAGILIVDGKFGEPDPESTFIGRLQRWPVLTTLGLTIGVTGLAIIVFAHMSITYFGFTRSIGQGLACLFLPLIYSVIYGFMNWVDNKAPVKAILLGLGILGFATFLIIRGGGFQIITNAFR